MAKKSFKDDNPALAFISTSTPAQKPTHDVAQDVTQKQTPKNKVQKAAQEHAQEAARPLPPTDPPGGRAQDAQLHTHEAAHDDAQEVAHRRPIRTQGRKGKKKPRINMAFEPDIYEYVRLEADRQDMSITQCVNEILYQHMMLHKK